MYKFVTQNYQGNILPCPKKKNINLNLAKTRVFVGRGRPCNIFENINFLKFSYLIYEKLI